MDYARRRRLKILARMSAHDLKAEGDLAARLATPGYRGLAERGFRLRLHAFDWNCPRHITPRFAAHEIEAAIAPLHARLRDLEAENARLRGERESLSWKPSVAAGLIAAVAAFAAASSAARAQPVASDSSTATYRFVAVDGLKIFYREAGPKDAPTILLLHGYPSSSRMFATLIPLLADR